MNLIHNCIPRVHGYIFKCFFLINSPQPKDILCIVIFTIMKKSRTCLHLRNWNQGCFAFLLQKLIIIKLIADKLLMINYVIY